MPFTGKAQDIFRKGVIQMNDQFTTEAYNRQLVKHNQLYSDLIGKFISNQENIVQMLNILPHHEVAADMAKEAEQINSRFTLLN